MESSKKVLFLDLDGPLIPQRMFLSREPIPFTEVKFDQVAVNMINDVCDRTGRKIVIHSSWIRPQFVGEDETVSHCIHQGISYSHFHNRPTCDGTIDWRYTRIAKWLESHPEVNDYVIVDDFPYEPDTGGVSHPKDMKEHLLLVDFEDGLLMYHYRSLLNGDWTNERV